MNRILLFTIVAVIGCSPSESEKAERELALIEKTGGDLGELCAAKRNLAAAYLHENNEDKYKFADLDADISCRRAAQEGF